MPTKQPDPAALDLKMPGVCGSNRASLLPSLSAGRRITMATDAIELKIIEAAIHVLKNMD